MCHKCDCAGKGLAGNGRGPWRAGGSIDPTVLLCFQLQLPVDRRAIGSDILHRFPVEDQIVLRGRSDHGAS